MPPNTISGWWKNLLWDDGEEGGEMGFQWLFAELMVAFRQTTKGQNHEFAERCLS